MYVEENIYDVVAGYGVANGDGIIQNLRNVNANTRATQNAVNRVASNTGNMVMRLDSIVDRLDDTIRVSVASPESLYVYSASTPLVFRIDTTLQQQQDLMQEIRDLTDTLVNDTPRTNTILGRVVPSLDSALTWLVDKSPVGMVAEMAKGFADSIQAKIEPFYDFVSIDTALVDSAIATIDTMNSGLESVGLLPYDSTQGLVYFNPSFDSIKEVIRNNPFSRFERWNDSIVDWVDSAVQERINQLQDTTKDTIPLDSMVSDSANIRNKLQSVFLPDEILYECFDFHLNHTFRVTLWNKEYSWDFKILIDFADLFGLDLCEFIRNVVKILTFIVIIFTTVKGYIRAFGGTNL